MFGFPKIVRTDLFFEEGTKLFLPEVPYAKVGYYGVFAVWLTDRYIVPVCDRRAGSFLCALFAGMCCVGLARKSSLNATARSAREHFASAWYFPWCQNRATPKVCV